MPSPSSSRFESALRRARVNASAAKLAALLAILGVALLWVATDHVNDGSVATLLRELGALLFVTGTLTLLWDIRGKRLFSAEVLAAANLSSEVTQAGLSQVTNAYLPGFDWERLFRSSTHLDLYFAYGQTWRNTHAQHLREYVARSGTRLRVVIPDKDNQVLVEQIAARFEYTRETLTDLLTSAEADFRNLAQQVAADSTVEVKRLALPPVYSYYRFDQTAVFVLYAQTPGRTSVPAFACEQGGTLWDFFKSQFEDIWRLARPIAST